MNCVCSPGAFEIFVFLILLALCAPAKARAGMQLYLVGLYLWAGLHKAQGEFIDRVVPWFAEPFDFELSATSTLVVGIGIVVAEAGGGLALLLPPLRRVAVLVLLDDPSWGLLVLGPWGHDWDLNVWPGMWVKPCSSGCSWPERKSVLEFFSGRRRRSSSSPSLYPYSIWGPANLSHALYAGNYAQPGFGSPSRCSCGDERRPTRLFSSRTSATVT